MQFLSGVGGLGSTPVDLQYVLASLDAQAARQGARLKKNADAAVARTPLWVDPASAAFEQRLFDQMRARKAAQEAAEEAAKQKKKMLLGAAAVLGAAFFLLK